MSGTTRSARNVLTSRMTRQSREVKRHPAPQISQLENKEGATEDNKKSLITYIYIFSYGTYSSPNSQLPSRLKNPSTSPDWWNKTLLHVDWKSREKENEKAFRCGQCGQRGCGLQIPSANKAHNEDRWDLQPTQLWRAWIKTHLHHISHPGHKNGSQRSTDDSGGQVMVSAQKSQQFWDFLSMIRLSLGFKSPKFLGWRKRGFENQW